MSKILKKKFKTLSPITPKIIKWMHGKLPVTCPNCKIQLLRSKENLSEQCKNCLKDVTYTVLK